MAYNLTENQKDLARWIVQDIRNGILEEEFDFFWIEAGRTLGGLTGDDPDGKIMTRGNVQALFDAEMLRPEGETSGRLGVAVRGRLYEAVESNFGAASTERPRSTTKQKILQAIERLFDEGQQFSYDKWPKANSSAISLYLEFNAWMAQVIDVARQVKPIVGSGALGMANAGRRLIQTTRSKGAFDTAHESLLEALNVARKQVNDLWPDEPIVEQADVQHEAQVKKPVRVLRKGVFISYSRVDAEVADSISSILDELNIGSFRDVQDIKWGDFVTSRIHDGIRDCFAILVIISPASLKSQWVPYEIGYATAYGSQVLLFLTHPALELPLYMRDRHYVTSLEDVNDFFANTFSVEISDAAFTPISPEDYLHSQQRPAFEELRQLMPELFLEMKDDVLNEKLRTVRHFYVLPSQGASINTDRKHFVYYKNEHDDLQNKIDLLVDHGLIMDQSTSRSPMYRMTDDFVKQLQNMEKQRETDRIGSEELKHLVEETAALVRSTKRQAIATETMVQLSRAEQAREEAKIQAEAQPVLRGSGGTITGDDAAKLKVRNHGSRITNLSIEFEGKLTGSIKPTSILEGGSVLHVNLDACNDLPQYLKLHYKDGRGNENWTRFSYKGRKGGLEVESSSV